MKMYKAQKWHDDLCWILEFHYDIFWDLVEHYGYTKEVICKRCKKESKYNYKMNLPSVLKCSKCDQTFSPMAGTIFNNSKLYLPFWLKAIFLCKKANPNIKLVQLCNELNCTNVTACNIRKKIKSINEDSIEYKLMEKHKEYIQKYLFQ